MIEKVAIAIEIAAKCRPYGLYDYSSYKYIAKAAIEAMREPTEEMIEAIDDSFDWDSSDTNGSWFIKSADPKAAWIAGIDAVLKDSK